MRIRQATSADARAIRALIWQVGINPIGLSWPRFLVAVDDQDRVIGCGQIKPHGDGSRELASIAVQPAYQGQGIGRQIILRLLGQAQFPLHLTCRASIETYYHQFGFRSISPAEMTRYFRFIYRAYRLARPLLGGREDLRVMKKTS